MNAKVGDSDCRPSLIQSVVCCVYSFQHEQLVLVLVIMSMVDDCNRHALSIKPNEVYILCNCFDVSA